MKPVTRWVIVVAAIVVIAILFVLWNQREKAPPVSEVAEEPAPTPPPAPVRPAVEPVTASLLFDFDRAILRSGEMSQLDELAAKFNAGGYDAVDAIGYADRIGSEEYNLRLSEQRVAAVRAYLVGKGVSSASIRTQARGEKEAASGDACMNMGAERRTNRKLIECLQPDRRVAITLAPKAS
jgi:OOP family OmpA-OmpF porin